MGPAHYAAWSAGASDRDQPDSARAERESYSSSAWAALCWLGPPLRYDTTRVDYGRYTFLPLIPWRPRACPLATCH
jgi:hypothetical protein